MAVVQSKDSHTTEEQEQEREAKRKMMKALTGHLFLNVVSLCVPVQAAPMIASQLHDNDLAKTAQFLGRGAALTSLVEFLVNPITGQWSDANGRLKILRMGVAANAFLPLMYAALPKSTYSTLFLRVVAGTFGTITGSTLTLAAIHDVAGGDQQLLNESQGMFGAMAGLGVITGPFLGALVLALTGSPSAVFALKGFISLGHLVWMQDAIKETLSEDRKKPFDGKFKSPFNFLDLFTTSPMLRQCTIFSTLQCMGEGKCVNDLNQLWMKAQLNWNVASTARWTIAYGVMMMFNGAVLTRKVMPKLGARTYVTMSNVAGVLSMLLYGGIHKGWAYNLGLIANAPAINAMGGASVKARGFVEAGKAGMGNADYSAKFANLRSLVYVVGPQLYLAIFARQVAKKQNPGMAYFLCALIAFALPELFHQQWSEKDFPNKKS